MNEAVAEILKSYLTGVNFIDQLGGLVKVSEVKQSDGSVKLVPVDYSLAQHQLDKNNHPTYVPDDKKRSVVYFEDGGWDTVRHGATYIDIISSIKLVAWFNLERIDKDLNNATTLMFLIAKEIPRSFPNQSNILKGRIEFAGIDVRNKEIFAPYDYDEAELQMLLYPHDYGAINYNIYFSIKPDCVDDIILNPDDCLTNSQCNET